MANRVAAGLTFTRKVVLGAAGVAALAIPVVVGMVNAPVLRAEAPVQLGGPPSALPNVPKFKTVSIKPCELHGPFEFRGGDAPVFVASPPGTLRSGCATLYSFIWTAYVLYEGGHFHEPASATVRPRLEGGPIWIYSARYLYRISATAMGSPSDETMRGPMLQALLEARLGLGVIRETREVPIYILRVASGGPALQASREGACEVTDNAGLPFASPSPPPMPGRKQTHCGIPLGGPIPGMYGVTLAGKGIDLDAFSAQLASSLGHPVLNHTGIRGQFDFNLKFATDETPRGPLTPPSVFDVLRKRLGLKLEATRGQREFITIEHAEKPE